MTKTLTIFGLLTLLLISTAFAELKISGNSILDKDDNIWSQNVRIDYPNSEEIGEFQTSEKITIMLGCEDLGVFNTANPTHTIINVSLFADYYGFGINQFFFKNFTNNFQNYGCEEGSPSCDITNTPPSTISDNFLCTLFGLHCEVTLIGQIETDYYLNAGEYLSLSLITYYNQTNGALEDSFCRFRIKTISKNCEGCGEKSFEEVTKELSQRQAEFDTKNSVFSYITTTTDKNYQIWAIIYWFIKIGIFVGAIFLLISIPFYAYTVIKKHFPK